MASQADLNWNPQVLFWFSKDFFSRLNPEVVSQHHFSNHINHPDFFPLIPVDPAIQATSSKELYGVSWNFWAWEVLDASCEQYTARSDFCLWSNQTFNSGKNELIKSKWNPTAHRSYRQGAPGKSKKDKRKNRNECKKNPQTTYLVSSNTTVFTLGSAGVLSQNQKIRRETS